MTRDTSDRCRASLDSHKDAVFAGVRRLLANDDVVEELRRFGTTTAALPRAAGVPLVAVNRRR